jgi:hypothetical protein
MERQADNAPDAEDRSPKQPRPERPRRERHHLRRSGAYFDVDAHVDVAYGDGTPGSLADVLWQPAADRWHPGRSPWDPAHASWSGDEEDR